MRTVWCPGVPLLKSPFAFGLLLQSRVPWSALAAVHRACTPRGIVLTVGIATFGCGFLAGALLNVYLWLVPAGLAQQFRTTLTYPSAILGDGLVLPIVNMTAATFLLRERARLTRRTIALAVLLGVLVTVAFHVDQALNG